MKILLYLILLCCAVLGADELETVWEEKFSQGLKGYAGKAEIVEEGDEKILKVTEGMATKWLDVPDGETLQFSALIRGENITRQDKSKSGQGARFGCFYTKPKNRWISVPRMPLGSFEWKKFTFKVDIPLDTTRLQIQMGLKEATGIISFKDVKVEVVK